MRREYRAVVECTEQPCSYCGEGARPRNVVAHPAGPFNSEQEAKAHGHGISRNVYGASVHRVLVESREVTDWATV